MSSVLEAPETVREEEWRDSSEAAQAVPLEAPASRRQFWRLLATYAASLVRGIRQRSRRSQDVIVGSRRPELQSLDCLARDYPNLYLQIVGWG